MSNTQRSEMFDSRRGAEESPGKVPFIFLESAKEKMLLPF